MKKILLIGWKDLILAFRDRAALILMLAAPFVLTLGLGFVTGGLSGGSGLSNIPLVVVNQDSGQIGSSLVDLLQSDDLAELFTTQAMDDPVQARQLVDKDQTAAVVIVPPGFSASIIPTDGSGVTAVPVTLELYANPSRPTSVGVIKTILEEFINRVEIARVGAQVTVTQLVVSGRIQPRDAAQVGARIGAAQGAASQQGSTITLKNVTNAASPQPAAFNVLAYMAPGMALMFLMFTVSNGGRTLLAEQRQGTLPRLLVTPISTTQVLGGKVFGIYLTGVAQMLILIVASSLFFSLKWGDLLGVLVLVLAAVVGAVGWGMLITSLAKTPGQVGSIGSAVMLIFGILGGTFISLENMPPWLQVVSKITPNAWGLDGFTTLALGGGLGQILGPVIALIVMGAVLFTAAVVLINRRGFVQR